MDKEVTFTIEVIGIENWREKEFKASIKQHKKRMKLERRWYRHAKNRDKHGKVMGDCFHGTA